MSMMPWHSKASVPTPPAMKFKLVDPKVYDFLNEEEEWWSRILLQVRTHARAPASARLAALLRCRVRWCVRAALDA